MQKTKSTFSVQTLAIIGVLSALVFATCFLEIPMDTSSRIHLGNIMPLLSGLLFGPLIGGLSAGIGSMLYDFTNPRYTLEFWVTFLTKFAMGFAAGWLNRYAMKKFTPKLRLSVSATSGAVLYIILYLFKNFIKSYYVLGEPANTLWIDLSIKLGASSINAVVGVIGSVLLALALRPRLEASGLFRQQQGGSGV